MSLKWPHEVVYQIFPDRFHCHDPAARPASGAFTWRGKPIRVSDRPEAVTSREHHQYSFFGGTLEGIRQKLPDLQDLGITTIYLNPIFKSRSTHRYDTDDYFTIDPMLGTRADFDRLVEDLHARGMKIMLDGVFNHTSYEHGWFQTRKDFYMQAGPNEVETWMGTGAMPKLDVSNPELAEQLLAVIDHWKGVDGWRFDASHLLPKRFMQRLKAHVGPDRLVVGEDWEDARFDLEDGCYDAVTNFSFQRNVLALLNGDCPPETLVRRLRVIYEGYPWPAVVQSWTFLNNHDTDRAFSKIGDRPALYRLAQALQFTLPGTPMVFYGDEWAMTGWGDWQTRAPMIWQPSPEQMAVRASLKDLIALRKAHPVLATGGVRFLHACNTDRTLAFERFDADVRALILMNFSPFERTLEGHAVPPRDWRLIWR